MYLAEDGSKDETSTPAETEAGMILTVPTKEGATPNKKEAGVIVPTPTKTEAGMIPLAPTDKEAHTIQPAPNGIGAGTIPVESTAAMQQGVTATRDPRPGKGNCI